MAHPKSPSKRKAIFFVLSFETSAKKDRQALDAHAPKAQTSITSSYATRAKKDHKALDKTFHFL